MICILNLTILLKFSVEIIFAIVNWLWCKKGALKSCAPSGGALQKNNLTFSSKTLVYMIFYVVDVYGTKGSWNFFRSQGDPKNGGGGKSYMH